MWWVQERMGREAMETSESLLERRTERKKPLTEKCHRTQCVGFVAFDFQMVYTAGLYAGGDMGMIQER